MIELVPGLIPNSIKYLHFSTKWTCKIKQNILLLILLTLHLIAKKDSLFDAHFVFPSTLTVLKLQRRFFYHRFLDLSIWNIWRKRHVFFVLKKSYTYLHINLTISSEFSYSNWYAVSHAICEKTLLWIIVKMTCFFYFWKRLTIFNIYLSTWPNRLIVKLQSLVFLHSDINIIVGGLECLPTLRTLIILHRYSHPIRLLVSWQRA